MTDGMKQGLKVAGTIAASMVLGAAIYKGAEYGVQKIRWETVEADTGTEKNADGKVVKRWKTQVRK